MISLPLTKNKMFETFTTRHERVPIEVMLTLLSSSARCNYLNSTHIHVRLSSSRVAGMYVAWDDFTAVAPTRCRSNSHTSVRVFPSLFILLHFPLLFLIYCLPLFPLTLSLSLPQSHTTIKALGNAQLLCKPWHSFHHRPWLLFSPSLSVLLLFFFISRAVAAGKKSPASSSVRYPFYSFPGPGFWLWGGRPGCAS